MRKWLKELDDLLRGGKTRPELLAEGTAHLELRPLVIASVVLGVIYGVCMGLFAAMTQASGGAWQILSSAIKVPALFYLTFLITFPSLYVFSALLGVRISALDVLRVVAAAITINLVVLASFGPITAFFTVSTDSYAFMKLLNVLFFGVSGIISLVFLWKFLKVMDAAREAPAAREEEPEDEHAPPKFRALGGERIRKLFKMWLIIYAIVGAQMSWVLRPFIGAPNLPFEWFRDRQSNFFLDILRTIDAFLGLS